MLRYVLLMLFLVVAARVLRRVAGGVFHGAAGRPRRSHPPQHGVRMVRDPVCGTYVVRARALTAQRAGRTQYFCSEQCRKTYLAQ